MMMLVPIMSDERQVEHLAERADQQRFAESRHAFEQRVPTDEQAGHDAMHDVGVADDDLADFLLDAAVGFAKLVGTLLHGSCGRHSDLSQFSDTLHFAENGNQNAHNLTGIV
jgi:hypothetical protein